MIDSTEALALASLLLDPDTRAGATGPPLHAEPPLKAELMAGGMSGAAVFRINQFGHSPLYLKAARGSAAAPLREEIARTAWLRDRGMPVARIVGVDDDGVRVAVLTLAVPGVPADVSPLPTAQLMDALAAALAAMHALPAGECPFDESLAVRLARATRAVSSGEVDPAHFEPRNRGVTPEALLRRLIAGRCDEDVVVVHGDATLANIMIAENGTVGFIDCGNAGRADRYTDLAVLTADIEANHGADAAALFISGYGGGRWDSAKARYFLDLYELF